MKRSVSVALSIMGALSLAACQQEKSEVIVFETLEQCKNSGTINKSECDVHYQEAQKQAEKENRFTESSSCEAIYGKDGCRPVVKEDGTSIFIPMMAGFMISQALNSSGGTSYEERRYWDDKRREMNRNNEERKNAPVTGSSRPLYTTASKPQVLSTSSNTAITTTQNTGKPFVAQSSTVKAQPKAVTLKRSGFSSSGARASSGG